MQVSPQVTPQVAPQVTPARIADFSFAPKSPVASETGTVTVATPRSSDDVVRVPLRVDGSDRRALLNDAFRAAKEITRAGPSGKLEAGVAVIREGAELVAYAVDGFPTRSIQGKGERYVYAPTAWDEPALTKVDDSVELLMAGTSVATPDASRNAAFIGLGTDEQLAAGIWGGFGGGVFDTTSTPGKLPWSKAKSFTRDVNFFPRQTELPELHASIETARGAATSLARESSTPALIYDATEGFVVLSSGAPTKGSLSAFGPNRSQPAVELVAPDGSVLTPRKT